MQHEQGGMTVVEFIGFIVSLGAILFLLLKQFFDDRAKKRDPKAYEERQRKKEQAIRALMGEEWVKDSRQKLEEGMDEEEEAPMPPPRPVVKESKPAAKRHFEPVDYQVERLERPSRGAELVKQFPNRKELFMIKEILDQPVGLRDEL